jgi:hypothetical protein
MTAHRRPVEQEAYLPALFEIFDNRMLMNSHFRLHFASVAPRDRRPLQKIKAPRSRDHSAFAEIACHDAIIWHCAAVNIEKNGLHRFMITRR